MGIGPILRMIRAESTPSGSVGILAIDGIIHSWTLQPDPTDEHFHIPAGTYPYKRFHGAKHPDTFEIVVPGHTALLFHPGNSEADTEGCILLGYHIERVHEPPVRVIRGGTSKVAFKDFMLKMNGAESGLIKIEDV
jgi:hypothetical protein